MMICSATSWLWPQLLGTFPSWWRGTSTFSLITPLPSPPLSLRGSGMIWPLPLLPLLGYLLLQPATAAQILESEVPASTTCWLTP